MSKPIVYGLEITLNCRICKKECHMENPFAYLDLRKTTAAKAVLEAIGDAYVSHQIADKCRHTE